MTWKHFFSQKYSFILLIMLLRGHKGWLFKKCTFANWYFSFWNIAHHLWTVAVLGGLWSNGWYYPILLTYIISSINLGSPNDPLRGYQQASLVKLPKVKDHVLHSKMIFFQVKCFQMTGLLCLMSWWLVRLPLNKIKVNYFFIIKITLETLDRQTQDTTHLRKTNTNPRQSKHKI